MTVVRGAGASVLVHSPPPASTAAAGKRRALDWRFVVALLGYVVISLVLIAGVFQDPTHTWPAYVGDNYKYMSFFAWIPYAISHFHNPLFIGAIDYKHGVNLAWETPVPFDAIVLWPITAIFGTVITYNVATFLAFCLGGFCTYLWIHRHVRSHLVAFFAGALVVLSPFVTAHGGHINLISFWPIPLMLIALEYLPSNHYKRAGLVLGLLTAIQLYLAEELVALAAIVVVCTAIVAFAVLRENLLQRWRNILIGGLLGGVVFGLLAAPMLAYQFLGPLAIHNAIQPYDMYVTDLTNFFIPTPITLFHSSENFMAKWSAIGESTSYLGLPLLLLGIYTVVRLWREPLVKVVGITTFLVMILSLGPHLHVNGHDTGIRMPAVLFHHLPLFDNVLPVRLSLFTFLGFAMLAAFAISQLGFRKPFELGAVSVVAVAAAVSIVPANIPRQTSSAPIPQYFSSSGAVQQLPKGTVALIVPFTDNDSADPVSMLWQAESNFKFSMLDGMAITVNPQGFPTALLDSKIRDALHPIQRYGTFPDETPALRQALTDELRSYDISVVIVGPMPHRDEAVQFLTWLIGHPPTTVQGVQLWSW